MGARRGATAALTVALAITLGACSGSDDGDARRSDPGPREETTTTTAATAPDGTAVSAADERLLRLLRYEVDDAAEYALVEAAIDRCMTEAGMPYETNAFSPELVRRTGPTSSSAERARRGFGYASAGEDPPTDEQDTDNLAHWEDIGDAWIEALNACEAPSLDLLTQRAEAIAASLSEEDAQYLEDREADYIREAGRLQPRWSACMEDEGFDFETQSAMHDELEAAADEDGALEREIAAAVADDRCAEVLRDAQLQMFADMVEDVGGTERFGDPYELSWTAP